MEEHENAQQNLECLPEMFWVAARALAHFCGVSVGGYSTYRNLVTITLRELLSSVWMWSSQMKTFQDHLILLLFSILSAYVFIFITLLLALDLEPSHLESRK